MIYTISFPIYANDHFINIFHLFLQVMNPLARALNIFQTDNYMYAGSYTVVIAKLISKLKKRSNLQFCECLRDKILSEIDKR